MTDQNPLWHTFINRLCKRLGSPDCDTCVHDFTYALAILQEMGDFDADASKAFWESRGGHCDCEILYNVVDWRGH